MTLTPDDLIFVGECFGEASDLTDLVLAEIGDMEPADLIDWAHAIEAQMREVRLRMDCYA